MHKCVCPIKICTIYVWHDSRKIACGEIWFLRCKKSLSITELIHGKAFKIHKKIMHLFIIDTLLKKKKQKTRFKTCHHHINQYLLSKTSPTILIFAWKEPSNLLQKIWATLDQKLGFLCGPVVLLTSSSFNFRVSFKVSSGIIIIIIILKSRNTWEYFI